MCAFVAADSATDNDVRSVKDYKFLSRLDALLDMLRAMDVLEDLRPSDTRPSRRARRRPQAAHVYSVRRYILKCCRQGFCDSADVC